MTHRDIANHIVIVILGLGCSSPGAKGAAVPEAEVHQLSVHEASSGNADFIRYDLKFDMRLTNRSANPLVIPTFQPGESVQREVVTLGIEVRQADGTWKAIMGGDWFGNPTIKHNPCGALPAGGTAEMKDAVSALGLSKEQWASLGREMTIRLNLLILCSNPAGKKAIDVTSEPFTLRLPDHLR